MGYSFLSVLLIIIIFLCRTDTLQLEMPPCYPLLAIPRPAVSLRELNFYLLRLLWLSGRNFLVHIGPLPYWHELLIDTQGYQIT